MPGREPNLMWSLSAPFGLVDGRPPARHGAGTFARSNGPGGPSSSASGTFSQDQTSQSSLAYRADGHCTLGTGNRGPGSS